MSPGAQIREHTEKNQVFPADKTVGRMHQGTTKVCVSIFFPKDLFFSTKYFIIYSYPPR